jgi:hypothetical protein
MNPQRVRLLVCFAWFCTAALGRAAVLDVTFDETIATREWTLAEVNPELPHDWTPYEFLVVEFRATSSQRFELGLKTATDHISKRIHPYPNVWVRASIPLRFYRQGLGDAHDLAATVNQPRDAYWINVEGGGHGPTDDVRGLSVVMRYPAGAPTLQIRSVTLAKSDPGDAVLERKPLIDEFGQYVHADWPGKAKSDAELQRAWRAEEEALEHGGLPDRCPFGGFASMPAKATGFFRVEQVGGRWWFVCLDGHLFYSTGVNGVGVNSTTRITGREDSFATHPPPLRLPSSPTSAARGTGPGMISHYGANVLRRYGSDWPRAWATLTAKRFKAWGLNTAYGGAMNDILGAKPPNQPYVQGVRFQVGPRIMGLPDVYGDTFGTEIDAQTAEQLAANKNDPYLLGTFIGNEPPWPGRESQFVDLVLAGDLVAMRAHFRAELAKGDTPERRRDLVLAAFARYLDTINAAVKKHDPNHLNLGIRFGGAPPAYVVALAKDFDVYSLNKYRWEPPVDAIREVHALLGKPLLLGEFHFGVAGRGLAPGLVMAMNQAERAQAYRFYVEHAAAHPEVIGTHWFQWIDQPATGRSDGENYNIGWVDVTDRPYEDLIAAAKVTHARLLDLHLAKILPTDRMPVASEVGTPAEGHQFGRPGIQ